MVYPFEVIKCFLFFCWCIPAISFAQYTADRSVLEVVDVESQTELKVENKYGDIKISTWENSKMEFKFTFKVRKNDKYDAEDLSERIIPVISNFGKYVSVRTEIEEKNTGFFGRLLSQISVEIDKSDIEIDIEIKVPTNTELEIENEFGDVLITDWDGRLRTKIKHGDLHVTESIQRANINHNYGRVNLMSVKNGEFDFRNVRFNADAIEDLRLDSHGSELEIDSISFLNILSNKDELRVESIKRIKGEIRFGTALVEVVKDEIYLDLRVADLRISKIINPNPNIYLNEQNSEVDINITGLKFDLDADMEGGIFRLPEAIKNVESNLLDAKSNHRKISASYGTVKDGKIKLEGKKGFVILREL